jgi:hypothetical protein
VQLLSQAQLESIYIIKRPLNLVSGSSLLQEVSYSDVGRGLSP